MDPLEAHLQRQIEHSRDFFWHRLRWKAVAGELGAEPFELTDVGAGIGLVGTFMATQYPSSTYRFVEPLESLVTELEARFGAAANHNGAASYAGSRYITLLDVLEHIEDHRGFLEDLTAKMDPGATLVMTVPALLSLWSEWDVALGHYRRYDKAMIADVFAGLPVRVREVSYLFPEMLPPALLRRRRRPASAPPDSAGTGIADADASKAEFPDLPRPVNELLYQAGSLSLRGRRRWPAGTSVLAIVDRV
jgi:hypothetical protein